MTSTDRKDIDSYSWARSWVHRTVLRLRMKNLNSRIVCHVCMHAETTIDSDSYVVALLKICKICFGTQVPPIPFYELGIKQ